MGTGFVFGLKRENGTFMCIVTNKHVIRGAKVGRFFFTRETQERDNRPDLGKRYDVQLNNFEAHWYGHPNPDIDIAAMPFGPILNDIEKIGIRLFYSYFSDDLIAEPQQLETLDAIEEVLIVGYPSGIYDEVNLLPVFRRGVTATPVQLDYGGQPKFLVDASIFPGSSGSPVLIYNLAGYSSREAFNVGTRILFLGMISSVFYRTEEGSLAFKDIPTTLEPVVNTRQMIDLAVAFKASAVLDTVQRLFSNLVPHA